MEDFKNKVAEISEDNEYWGDIDSFNLEAPFQLPTVQQPKESVVHQALTIPTIKG
jgi:hypothetical protein